MAPRTPKVKESFRVPNSVIQDITTNASSDLSQLNAFQTVTLLGLLAGVLPKAPEKPVRMRLSEVLEIIEVGKLVESADREWKTATGEARSRRYQCQRFSPAHLQRLHEALLALYATSVVIHRWVKHYQHRLDDRLVHVLDMFGYTYRRDGKLLDLDDLPAGSDKVNVGSGERPVWRIRRRTENGHRYDRPTGILFRLNTELAAELVKQQGTIGFTIMARKVFSLLRQYMRNPPVIRLILLILRQTGENFTRNLPDVIASLGFDQTHPGRAAKQLGESLAELEQRGLVVNFNVDAGHDVLTVVRNTEWHRKAETA